MKNIDNIISFINQLILKDIIYIREDLYDKYSKKKIRVLDYIKDENRLNDVILTDKQKLFINRFLEIHLHQHLNSLFKLNYLISNRS